VVVPSPGTSVVGRTKIAEDNSPLPRDRIIFNSDYFNNTPLSAHGINVTRYSVGFEKTFLDQMASIEFRLPFASTLNSNVVSDGSTGYNTELGNLNITFKALLLGGDVWNVAAGVGVALPTADDLRVRNPNGGDVLRFKNQEIFLTPYIAALYTPNDRLFGQAWVAYGFDTNGNPVLINPSGTGGLLPAGRFNDQTLAQLDAQIGYWAYVAGDRSACLQRLAPFGELHYNSTVNKGDVITSGGTQFGTPTYLNELNFSAGVIAQIYDNFNLSAGVVTPLRDRPNRTFDYQIGIRGNLFFGPTAQSRSAAAQVSSF
jgi:hypothetical protein